ncbi:MAG: hypothetical protein AB1801_02495 [Chloroflexota bacterium]
MPDATIASFILRFTQEQTSGSEAAARGWRGVIRHVQTQEEIHFVQIQDALAFMARYIDLTGKSINKMKGERECD